MYRPQRRTFKPLTGTKIIALRLHLFPIIHTQGVTPFSEAAPFNYLLSTLYEFLRDEVIRLKLRELNNTCQKGTGQFALSNPNYSRFLYAFFILEKNIHSFTQGMFPIENHWFQV